MNTLLGTEEIFFPEADDGVNGPLSIPTGFPFGSSVQTNVFVSCIYLFQRYNPLPTITIIHHRLVQMEFCHLGLDMDRSSIKCSQEVHSSVADT